MMTDLVDVTTNPDTGEEVPMIPEAAYNYANENKWKLPSKIKDAETLVEILEEKIKGFYEREGIPLDQAFECDRCKHTVQPPDMYCWYCGHDISDDGDGGFQTSTPNEEDLEEEIDDEAEDIKEEIDDEEDDTKEEISEVEDKLEEEATESLDEAEDDLQDDFAKEIQGTEEEKDEDEDDEDEELDASPPPGSGDELPEVTEECSDEDEQDVEILPPEKEERDTGTLDILMMEHEEKPKDLNGYTKRIRTLNANAGANAWKIGKYLNEVKERGLYTAGGYEDFKKYVETELDCTHKTAKNFMKFSMVFEQHVAEILGTYKMELLLRSPQAVYPRLLKAALPKSEGGSGLSRNELEKQLNTEKKKLKIESTRGRKPSPLSRMPLKILDGKCILVKLKGGGETEELIPDTALKMVIKMNKGSSQLEITFSAVQFQS